MQPPALHPAPELVRVLRAFVIDGALRLDVATRRAAAACPRCHQLSTKVHSRYRRVAVLRPWAGCPLRADIESRKWFCHVPTCPQRIFTERLPGFLAPHGRRACDVVKWLRLLGHSLGGERGAVVSAELGFGVSPDTVLRELQRSLSHRGAAARKVTHLGVDDFAFAKGRRHGTLLVDLDTHEPIGLLPDREQATLAAWLRGHPEIKHVSRDGSKTYAAAIREGAPQSAQGSDPFHLAQGVTQALLDHLRQEEGQWAAAIEAATRAERLARQEEAGSTAAPAASALPGGAVSSAPAPGQEQEQEQDDGFPGYGSSGPERERSRASRQRRLDLYQAVKRLQACGSDAEHIAQALGIHHVTATRLMASDAFRERKDYRAAPTALTPHLPRLERRWEEGCRGPGELWRELQALGYPDGPSAVEKWVRRRWRALVAAGGVRPPRHPAKPPPAKARRLKDAMWSLLHAGLGKPSPKSGRAARAAIFAAEFFLQAPKARRATELALEFLRLLARERGNTGEEPLGREALARALEQWIERVRASGIGPLKSFCTGLRQDWSAVLTGLVEPWSNGVLEGTVNRLKAIKRTMYGRGGLSSLQARVLPLGG